MPKFVTSTAEHITWQESHRCVICDGLPVNVNTELVEEHRTLKPKYRYLAGYNLPAESWQTEHIGGEYRTEVVCGNGHIFSCHYHRFKKDA